MKKAKTIVTSALAALAIGSASIVAFAASTGSTYVNNVLVEGFIFKPTNKKALANTTAHSVMDKITTTAILRYKLNGNAKSVTSINTVKKDTDCDTTASITFGEMYGATGLHTAEHNGVEKSFPTYLTVS